MDPQEARIYTAVTISCLVIGAIILYFFISIIRQQRRNLELHKQNILAEITILERERARIAADIHDDLGPILSVIKFNIDNVQAADEKETAQLEKASIYIDDLVTRIRKIARNLMPTALERKGLIVAVDEFVGQISDASSLSITFLHELIPDLEQQKAINIFRIVQEMAHNTIKHAHAKELLIQISALDGCIRLLFRDNGQGFDYEKALKESKGLGLRSLKGRTEIMGGNLIVESKEGVGSAFLFEIPINK
jgi:two-component system NarL family sensor kinase